MSSVHTETTYTAASLDFAAAFAILLVVYVEHRHAIRTSSLLGLYLTVGILIDATKSRSYFLRGLIASGIVSAVTGATRLALVILEEVPKTSLIIDPELRTISDGEATSGFFSRTLFLPLQPMLRLGYKSVLTLDDLNHIGPEFRCTVLYSQLSDSWPASKRHSKNSLFYACCKSWKWAILVALAPRLCLTGFRYSKPFVMEALISYIQKPNDEKKSSLIGALLLSYGGASLFQGVSSHLKNRLIIRVRGGLISLMFDKCYRLKVSEAKKQASITMMSADLESVNEGIPAFIEIPFAVIEAGCGTYFLSLFMDQYCVVIFIPLVITFLSSAFLGKRASAAFAFWNASIETRVTKTSQVLSQLPAMKSLGLGPQMARFLQSLRVMETHASRTYRTVQAMTTASAVLVDQLTPVLVIGVGLFLGFFGEEIDPGLIYPALGIITLVKQPLADVLTVYPKATSMLACFERLQNYLTQEEHYDPRVIRGSEEDVQEEKAKGKGPPMPDHIVRFESATIAPRGSNEALLSDVSFGLAEGSITAMFGPTSSGKTTLLEGMLGEVEVLGGRIVIDEKARHIAICGQEVFLPNCTVRECIIGACKFEPTWYNMVITYCKLVEDLQRMTNGDQHVIGSGGLGLSGGQRQRIGIARSVYARMKVIILDDALSALDKRTAVDIVMGLCGKDGLLRQQNCTVVISSYLDECVEVADNLMLLDGNGNLTFETCPSGSKARGQVGFLLRQGLLAEKEESPAEEAPVNGGDSKTSDPTVDDQSEDEGRKRGDKQLYLLWIDAVGRLMIAFLVLLLILVAISDSMPNIFIRLWIHIAPANKNFLMGYAFVSAASGVLAGTGLFVLYTRVAPRACNELHQKLATATTEATIGFLTTTDSGHVLNRYSEDMELISKRVPGYLYSTLYAVFTVTAHGAAILAGATYMMTTLPVILLWLWLLQQFYLRTSRQLRLLLIEAQAPLVTALRDAANGIIYARAYGNEERDFAIALELLERSQKPYYALLASQAFLNLALDLIVTMMTLVLALFALYLHDTTSPNATGLALLNLITLGLGFRIIISSWTGLETAIGSLARLRDFLKNTPTENRPGREKLPEVWPSRGEVIFYNVAAHYDLGTKTEQPAVLEGIQLHIEPGQKIGVMGRTGSGKTSLLRSMLGFLEYEGRLSIDGVEIKTVAPDEVRFRIVTISQELVELDGTIRDNLLPYDKCWDLTKVVKMTAAEKREAERKDRIAIETLLRLGIWEKLRPMGGLSCLFEKANYSFGEKQLFCIARAVVRKRLTGSKLILVDEATASIDSWRDQTVREMMLEYFSGCTLIVVAHREETIADSNHTVHMADGHIQRIEHF